jgi:hypothetical protein
MNGHRYEWKLISGGITHSSSQAEMKAQDAFKSCAHFFLAAKQKSVAFHRCLHKCNFCSDKSFLKKTLMKGQLRTTFLLLAAP